MQTPKCSGLGETHLLTTAQQGCFDNNLLTNSSREVADLTVGGVEGGRIIAKYDAPDGVASDQTERGGATSVESVAGVAVPGAERQHEAGRRRIDVVDLENGRCLPDNDDGCDEDFSCELFRRKMFRSRGCWEWVERKTDRYFWCYRCACSIRADE